MNEQHFINKTDEMIEEFIAECEREAAKLEITVDYISLNLFDIYYSIS